jgi:membrane protease YdiL (CAAX protease family)
MKKIWNFIKIHPVTAYFLMTLIISWGSIFFVLGPGGFTGTVKATDRQLPFLFLAMFAGPSVASILLTGFMDGREGIRELFSRLFRWRVGARWYVVAVLTAPLLMTGTLLALSLISPGFLPGILASVDKVSLLMTGIAAGLMTGFFEELGWTGFAVSRLKSRYGILTTGIIVGVMWGAWHYPLFSGGDSSGTVAPALFIPVLLFSHLPAYRVIMVWVYDRTGSLLIAMLIHAGLTGGTLIIQPRAADGTYILIYDLVLAAAMWVVIAIAQRRLNAGR